MARINPRRRVEIGLERKARTRRAIVEAALRLFAERGFDAPTTDDIVASAGIARGTLYLHFQTKEEIMRHVALEVTNATEEGFSEVLADIADPVDRIALRMRLLCQKALKSPIWGMLLLRVVPTGPLGTNSRFGFQKDLVKALASNSAKICSLQSALDMVQGTIILGIRSMLSKKDIAPHHIDDLIVTMLRGLGLETKAATKVNSRTRTTYDKAIAAGQLSSLDSVAWQLGPLAACHGR